MKKDYTEKVKTMNIDEAIAIASNVKKMYEEDPDQVITALLKLQSFESLIGDPLKTISDELLKILKKTKGSIEASTGVRIKDKEGVVEKVLTVDIKAFDVTKTDIDFDTLKEDNGVIIEDDPNDPCVKHIRVLDPKVYTLLKTPTIAGNPTAFEAALTADASLGKYRTTKTSSKYGVKIDLVNTTDNI